MSSASFASRVTATGGSNPSFGTLLLRRTRTLPLLVAAVACAWLLHLGHLVRCRTDRHRADAGMTKPGIAADAVSPACVLLYAGPEPRGANTLWRVKVSHSPCWSVAEITLFGGRVVARCPPAESGYSSSSSSIGSVIHSGGTRAWLLL